VNIGPRMRIWREANKQRVVMTADGPLIIYEGEYAMVVVGKSLEECRNVLCPMLREQPKEQDE